ncbi:MAG TPA: ABC-type transport auxiliary lipoprotein family protein [Tepidisphaeraceae bacterium]|jgi:uncharacterized lipoprotein YmbA
MMRSAQFLLSVAAALLAASCKLTPTQPYPEKDRFGLQAKGIAKVGDSPSGVIRIQRVHVAPPYNQREFVYRTGELSYSSDYYNLFVADPQDLITAEIVRGLTATGRFKNVLIGSSSADTPFKLEVTVTRLEGDFQAQPKAVIAMHAVLLQESDALMRVVGETDLEESQSISTKAAGDLSAGWSQALGRCIAKLGEWSHGSLSAAAAAPNAAARN